MKRLGIVVTNNMRRWGVTSVVLNLLKAMDRVDFKIYFISSLEMDDWFCKELDQMNVEILRVTAVRMKQSVRYVKELAGLLKHYHIDVLHVHGNSATMWLEVIAGKKAGVPLRIAHSHNSDCLSKAVHYILRPLLIHDMTLGIGCSDLAQKFAFNEKKSTVLKNGIPLENFQYNEAIRKDYRKELGLEEKYVIGHVGSFIAVKNQEFICQIAEEIKRRGIFNFCVLFLGDGATKNNVEAYAEEHGLEGNVRFLGSRADVSAFYQAMDLFVLPSLYEGFPMVLIEAQTAGLNCLISDKVTKTTDLLGTARFLDIEGEGAVKKWADAIVAAMKDCNIDRTAAGKMVEKAGFSAKQCAKQLREIYLRT